MSVLSEKKPFEFLFLLESKQISVEAVIKVFMKTSRSRASLPKSVIPVFVHEDQSFTTKAVFPVFIRFKGRALRLKQ